MRPIYEEYTKIWWVDEIADQDAPTIAELTAGVDVTPFVPKDGLKVGSTNNKVKADDITTAFMAEVPGSYGNALTLTCFRDDTTDTAWDTFKDRGTIGYLVVRRLKPYTLALAAAQKVEVYPGATGQPTLHDTAENERVKFGVDIMVSAPPSLEAVVAGA